MKNDKLFSLTIIMFLAVALFTIDCDAAKKPAKPDKDTIDVINYSEIMCPNCGNPFMSKENIGSLTYKKDANFSSGIIICKECLAHPERLDARKIEQKLIEYKWSAEDIKLVKKAVEEYKKMKIK